jgi:acyl-CoA synthetase (NDP forming)
VIKDCGRKLVRAAAIFTAGFSECGTEEGAALEREMVIAAKEYGLRLIGPNCIGIYCPSSKLAFFPGLSREEGHIGFISQSGGHAEELARQASKWGLTFSKIISYGNGCDLDSTDFLEYLGEDQDTKIVALYVEGVKDGTRFARTLMNVARSKPVVVWKGGTSENSARAAASHTGSLTGSNAIWNAILNHPGIIRVQDFEELGDTLLTIQYLNPPKNRNVAVVGAGGGFSVAVTDILDRFGLVVKRFTKETVDRLNEIIPPLGTGTKNPIDLSYFLMQDISLLKKSIEIVANDPNIDMVLTHISLDFTGNGALSDAFISRKQVEIVEVMVDIRNLMEERFPTKPFAVILNAPAKIEYEIDRLEINETLLEKGICVYLNSRRAANALRNLTQLQR